MEELIIIGAGATGRELVSVISDINAQKPTWKLVGFLDDDPAKQGRSLNGVPVLGPVAGARQYQARMVVAIAVSRDQQRRQKIVGQLALDREQFATIIHPSANISQFAQVGAGTVVLHNVVVTHDTVIGENVIIQYNVSIAHDVVIGDFVTIAPGAIISGFVHLRAGVYAGAGSTIINGAGNRPRVIGEGALIGIGAVVVGDVAPGITMVGNPARPLPVMRRS
jgi:sugar O-acyltransferase (sialic acid O-acetyltransferase NeuD family)